ncbi:biopolymer transporter ExbD [Oceaniovalibus sp. ACAM 378]|uniref:ExbD/TolR family protein n=1 Tax=Oceaniovalibus sp. ACAM 378 TaxID=2599923 RepID=UPI0011DAB437|nr:biopolymer transporter ExbD [Oceaniovalibus sp. ACAM 378]TYB86696.1 biopolymer transporter ExbD [Oceaniovalibus sp. ACAM 378]
MRRAPKRRPKEPTIALINIVFLMLIFFMVAGKLSPSMDRDITLVETQTLEGREPPDALVIDKTGQLRHRGIVLTSAAAFLDRPDNRLRDVVRLLPDRDLPAAKLLRISAELRAAGAERIMIATERAIR